MQRPAGPAGMRCRVEGLLGAAAVVLLVAVTAAVDPSEPGMYPRCPFRVVTGLDCPGCGSLRAMHDLAHADLLGAVDHNALLVVVLMLVAARAVWRVVRPGVGRAPGARWAPPVVAVGLVLWTVARNLPVEPFSVLAS
jgi:uncharacterized protein DUF2752